LYNSLTRQFVQISGFGNEPLIMNKFSKGVYKFESFRYVCFYHLVAWENKRYTLCSVGVETISV